MKGGGSSSGGAGGDRRPKLGSLGLTRAPSFTPLSTGSRGGGSAPGGCDDDERESCAPHFGAVVQIFTASVANDWEAPWSRSRPEKSTGSGWILSTGENGGCIIVTNAHVVEFSSTLQVRREGDSTKYEAAILHVAHDVDLALLTVSKASFWKDAPSLSLGPDPRIQQRVHVIGYPIGGENLSVTGGVVSRVDWSDYAQSKMSNLIVQVDSAINSGNSGGPAISNGRVCGVAFQSLEEGDNVGYIIPSLIVRRLVEDFKSSTVGALRGFAAFSLPFQRAENEALRKAVGVLDGVTGVLLGKPSAMSALAGLVEKNDVLAEVDGHVVSNDGRIRRGDTSALDFRVAFTLKLVGEPVALVVYRGKERREISTVAERVPELVPSTWFKRPSYVFVAGLVFIPLHMHDTDAAELSPFFSAFISSQILSHERATDQIVVLNGSTLPHSVTLGYEDDDFDELPLISVDGKRIRNLADVGAAVESASGPLVEFVFALDKVLVLPLIEGRAATVELMREYGIAAPWSADIAEELGRRRQLAE
jgi:S1-C subfamily serine protease